MHEFIDKEPVDPSGDSMLTALIDADSIAYIVGWGHKDLYDADAVATEVDNFVSSLLVQVQCRQYAGFLSPKITFRNRLYPEYKAQRKPPNEGIARWKPFINEHLRQNWGFGDWPDHEADDAVSMLQHCMNNTIICSPDKDMKQVPGNHFDYKKGIRFMVTLEQAEENFIYQLLVGDSSDNIKGCPGVGEKGAPLLIAEFRNLGLSLLDGARKTFHHKCKGEEAGDECMQLTSQLISLRKPLSLQIGDGILLLTRERAEIKMLLDMLHTFDLDAAGTTSSIEQSGEVTSAEDLFGDW